MIVLFTDFGPTGPYSGQMKAVLHSLAPGVPLVDLLCDAPSFNPRASAYLLAAFVDKFPSGSVFLCVVDPGVGGKRLPLIMRADGYWFVGPGNGLFNIVACRAEALDVWQITWLPEQLSASFHGRDLFAPVAARLARGEQPPGKLLHGGVLCDWPDDLFEVIYIDHFGNAMTGIRAASLSSVSSLKIGDKILSHARTFSDVREGETFWYENANSLVEIAVNQGNAARELGLSVGTKISYI